ncbi:MAG: putative hydro-lyase [Planctomycetota bacterium]|nr:putative hydro-lyase [Planctomycetota bacterium]
MNAIDPRMATGAEIRSWCRSGKWTGPTSRVAEGFAQANLVVVSAEHAFDFLLYCRRNVRECPVLDVTDRGSFCSQDLAPDSDLRTDLPRYQLLVQGKEVEEHLDVVDLWKEDAVAFLLGSSSTLEAALLEAELPVRHLEQSLEVPVFRTQRSTREAGIFSGPLLVSMRPMTPSQAIRAIEVTSRYPEMHGAPVHMGDPSILGITDLSAPDLGDPVPIEEGEIPVFWSCGLTSQEALIRSEIDWAITHAPGHLFVTDRRDRDLERD